MQSDALPERAAPGVAPLAYNQRSLWFIQQLVPEEPVYNMSRAWRVSGDLDVAALRRAIALLVERHEPLRAHVRLVEGEPELEDIYLAMLHQRARLKADQQLVEWSV